MLIKALAFVLSLIPSILHAELPANNPVPGGVAVVRLDVSSAVEPAVRFGERQIMVTKNRENWYAVVGLSAELVPGNYILTISTDNEPERTQRFGIKPLSAAAAQRTMQLPDALSDLSFEAVVPENGRDLVTQLWQYQAQPVFRFSPVVESKLLIPFGLLVNDTLTGRFVSHPSVTYFCPANALVYSPAPGIVQRIYTTKNAGIVLYINHGQGLASVISHIGETILKPGQEIESGELIGVVKPILDKQNGRVDWGLMLNGNLIDPLQFTPSS